jgi:hypothetical protein
LITGSSSNICIERERAGSQGRVRVEERREGAASDVPAVEEELAVDGEDGGTGDGEVDGGGSRPGPREEKELMVKKEQTLEDVDRGAPRGHLWYCHY